MTTNVENRIEFGNPGQNVGQLLRIGPERLVLLQKLGRDRVIFERFCRAGVERCFTSIRRCDNEFGFVFEDLVWVRKFRLIDRCQ